jgi:hypothetical protein
MDRLDAMKVFVVAVDEGSLAAAGRKLGRSPAAVSRAMAFLEDRAGSKLLYRTTRSIRLSEEGAPMPLRAGACSPNSRRPIAPSRESARYPEARFR